jgi:hypothetical protein
VGTKYPGYNFGGLFGQQNIVCYEINGFIMWFWTVRAGGGGGRGSFVVISQNYTFIATPGPLYTSMLDLFCSCEVSYILIYCKHIQH